MKVLVLILLLAANICFAIAAFAGKRVPSARVNFEALGLLFLGLSLFLPHLT